ncbi:Ankyrin-1 [Arthrobotrys entomopaga]|nr:Ankyrin-1 [Arthrobotrys entomopaga]
MSTSKDFHPIDETYNLMLSSIDEYSRDIADRTMSWLIVAKSPLRIQDLLVALSIEQGVFEIPEHQLLLQSTVLDICVGFIIVDESSSTVRLAHETVLDYLLRKPTDTADAFISLTKSCLNYLRFEQFASLNFWDSLGHTESAKLEGIEKIPFYLYTVRHWETQVTECDQSAIEEDLVVFLSQRSSVHSYCRVRKLTLKIVDPDPRSWFYRVGTDESPLHIAARVGHLGAVNHFISSGIDINITHNAWHQPIWEATFSDQVEVVKLLVEKGASPRTSWEMPRPASWQKGRILLHFAAAIGGCAVLKYLLQVDPEMVNIPNFDGTSALREATVFGQENTARLLLDAGADLVGIAGDNKTIGMIALERGRTNIFSLFLKKGLDLENPLSEGMCNSGRPLHIAAGFGYEETVKEILELAPKSCISLIDWKGNTALHNAVMTGSLPIVQMLVESGIDLNKENNESKTALQLAAEFDYVPIEEYLQNVRGVSSKKPERQELDKQPRSHTTADGISLTDIKIVYDMLTKRLKTPPLVAKKILDCAAYWVKQHVQKSGTVSVNQQDLPNPYLHLNISGPCVRRIVFRTVTHDQGELSSHVSFSFLV